VIVFSAFLVVVAVGLLVAGVVTSKLALVYVAIGVSGVSLLALGLGAILRRKELFGQAREAAPAQPQPQQVAAQAPPVQPDLAKLQQPAAAPAGYGWSAAAQPGPPQAGYLPSAAPSAPPTWESAATTASDLPPATFERPRSPAQQILDWRGNLPLDDPQPPPAVPPAGPGPFDDQPPAEDHLLTEGDQPPESDQELPPPERPEPAPADQPGAQVKEHAAEEHVAEEAAAEDRQPAPAEDAAEPAPAEDGAEPAPAEVDLLREVTVVPGVPRYHSAQCILIRFMGEDDLNRMPLGQARQAGCTPCRACQPDQA
jgi:hypothetical protein